MAVDIFYSTSMLEKLQMLYLLVMLTCLFQSRKFKQTSGQTYIDILIAVGILMILSGALFTLVTSSLEMISFTRARITARHLAQEKIELIRNLPYAEVGTTGGIPMGPLLQNEAVFRNGLNYTVYISIVYIDDPFDRLAPADLLPTDYKRVRVDVSWEGLATSGKNPITLITDIAPKGVETETGGGTLSILVFDASGEPVPQAIVNINALETGVNLTQETNDDGRVILPGTPSCVACYQVIVSKEGFSSEKTYSTEEVANPHKPFQTVLESEFTEVSFAIDKTSTLVVLSTADKNSDFQPLPNQNFQLKGEKTIGFDINDEPVYKYEESFTTDDSAQIVVGDLEWDNYHLFSPAGSGWDIAGTNPLNPISIFPNQEIQLAFALAIDSSNNLLAVFKDSSETPIASVEAKLSDSFGFEASGSSGLSENPDFGQIFFANLESRNYTLEATASGFANFSGSFLINGDTIEEIILNQE